MPLKKTVNGLSFNIYQVTLYRLLVMMGIFTILRIGFYFFNQSYFTNVGAGEFIYMLFGGTRFDLIAILYTNLLFILMFTVPFPFRYNLTYQNIGKWIYIITNSIIIAANCIDFIYFRFTLRRTTATIFKEFKNETNAAGLLGEFFLDYWYMFIVVAILVYVLIKLYGKPVTRPVDTISAWIYYPTGIVLLGLTAGLFVAGVRGGFAHSTRPITLSNAGEYVKSPLEIGIVLNTPFAIYKTLGIKSLDKVNFFTTDKELNAIYTPVHKVNPKGPFKANNVVILIVESFGKEYIGYLNSTLDSGKYKGYTPFMDSLISQSKYFHYSFANGTKSIDAMPSVLASIPSLVEPYVLTPYSSNQINSMASLLKKKGYSTSFFHGAHNGSMGFLAFANIAGYEKYFGRTEYANDKDFDGMWGIWDEEFLQYFADEMNKMKEPFLTSLFTVSSHHPFALPERYKGKFPEGNLNILKCIGYTDMSLKKFFAKASTMPWYKNTLFVITADHTSPECYYPEYKTNVGLFSVPVIFYKPGSDLKGMEEKIVQQNDIMPTVLNYLNYDEDYIAFGNDAFDKSIESFAVNYNNGIYQIFMGDHLLQFNGEKTTAVYDFKNDIFLKNNLFGKIPEIEQKMEKKVKAFIQQYNKRLIDDELIIKK